MGRTKIRISQKDIDRALKDNNWTWFNSKLYQLCSKNFQHKTADVVMAKICIIGRTYSASIERRKIKLNKTPTDDFYEKIVAPVIIRSHIDKWLSSVKRYKTINKNRLPCIMEIHSNLMKVFKKISGMDKRSLASKYLHFHLPSLFYIYDSRAVKGLRTILPNFRVGNDFVKCDPEYSKFCHKLFYLQEAIKEEYNKILTPRQLDRLLLLKA